MNTGRLPWGTLAPAVLIPNLFYAVGRGAVLPVIPLLAVNLGVGYGVAALIAALLTVGELFTTLAASWLVVKIGERNVMIVGSGVSIVGASCALAASNAAVLALGVFIVGAAAAVFTMARQAWVALAVPRLQRGRAYALVAGSQRIGMFIGPFVATLVISLAGHSRWAFAITIGCAVTLIVVLVLWPTPPQPPELLANTRTDNSDPMPGVLRTMVQRRDVLLRVGSAAAVLSSMRAVRQVIVPLWGAHLGLEDFHITLLVAVCNAIDVALVYAGGQLTDRFGRRWVGVPTLVGFAVAHAGLAASGGLPAEVQLYIGFAVLMALANSVSSGVNASMGADLADPRQPAVFLGPWRLVGEVGAAGVPLLFAAITAAASLAVGAAAMGALALAGAGAMWRYVPRFLPHERRTR